MRWGLFLRYHGHYSSAVRALVLGASGNKESSIIVDRSRNCADCRSDMPLLIDITIVQHGVPTPADSSIPLGLALDEYGPDAPCLLCRDLWFRRKAHLARE